MRKFKFKNFADFQSNLLSFFRKGTTLINYPSWIGIFCLVSVFMINPFVSFSQDTDGDGIADINDLDDDNDGIPDDEECLKFNSVVINGGFENPGNISKYVIIDAGSVPGWETTAPDNKIELWKSGFNSVPSSEGGFFAELNSNQASSLYQSFATAPGSIIKWSLDHRGRSGTDVAEVKIGNSVGTASTQQIMSDGTSGWGSYSGIYTVPAGQTTTYFVFEAISAAGGISVGNFLDDIQISTLTCYEELDTDNDGIPDLRDLDSDNDGIPDLVEAGGIDTNGDGTIDYPIANDPTSMVDLDGDGLADVYDDTDDGGSTSGWVAGSPLEEKDTDGDGIPDAVDLDSDNDGIPDIIEAGGSTPNNDGMVDVLAAPWDSDGDGLADIYDGNNSGTGLIITTADTNSDGKVNATESVIAGGTNNIDADGDGYPNHLDLDSDNDGITDVVENGGGVTSTDDTAGNLDGIVGNNPIIIDSNFDGWYDSSTTAMTDSDGDGIADYLDLDSDNDGIVDYLEGVCSTCPTFTTPAGNDTNGNGILDMYENLTSTNGTGGTNIGTTPNVDDNASNTTPDYLDTDTDNDGSYDWTEGFDANNNGNASDDLMLMATNYESTTSNGYYVNATDSDSDGIPDWLDNQPSISGHDVSSRPPFLNPASAFWYDEDNDGLVDLLDASQNGTAAPTPDNNGGKDLDWRDMTSLVSLPVELTFFNVYENDCAAYLKWSTASEKDFDYFLIERSEDGYNFERVEIVLSSGNENGDTYDFIDEDALFSNYYRLKMVDLDASVEYSSVVYVEINCEEMEEKMIAFPNPITPGENLTLEFTSESNDEIVVIVDMLGRVVRRMSIETEKGLNMLEMDISDLSVGNYYVQFLGRKSSKMISIQE
ncbi:MAG: T9SS type A sorting domain-containing protein [Saprospiraceae bacterium]